jgi:Uri superfamily endonuclease
MITTRYEKSVSEGIYTIWLGACLREKSLIIRPDHDAIVRVEERDHADFPASHKEQIVVVRAPSRPEAERIAEELTGRKIATFAAGDFAEISGADVD